jgi:hypothetical protein
MKKLLHIILIGLLAASCTKTVVINDPYSPGVCVGEIILGATEGAVSVSVEADGPWRLECDQNWLRTDVTSRIGDAAFTVYYNSNVSDIGDLREARTAKIAILLENSLKADTLVFVQRGLYRVEPAHNVVADQDLVLEYVLPQEQLVTLLCCSSEGTADVDAFIAQQNADITIKDGEEPLYGANGKIKGLNIKGCNFAGMSEDEEFEAFRTMINSTFNAGPDAGDNWIFAGQMYHLSSMMIGYPDTPQWYPHSTTNELFRSDIFAWQNNLYDCVWMYNQNYVYTYTDEQQRSYTADYVYVSPAVFSKIEAVELLEVEGMSHKPIKVTLKY